MWYESSTSGGVLIVDKLFDIAAVPCAGDSCPPTSRPRRRSTTSPETNKYGRVSINLLKTTSKSDCSIRIRRRYINTTQQKYFTVGKCFKAFDTEKHVYENKALIRFHGY